MPRPFEFSSEASIVRYSGIWADSAHTLLAGLGKVDGSSIFYHLHHALFRRHFTTSEFMNDFARWAWVTLHEERLAERLSTIDPLAVQSIAQAREQLVAVVQEHVGQSEQDHKVSRGRAFYFCDAQTFVFPTGIVARDLPDFAAKVRAVRPDVIFRHVIGARLRVEGDRNDFSRWIEDEHKAPELAAQILRLSPYTLNLNQLRGAIADAVERHLRA